MVASHHSTERVAIPPGYPIGLLFGRQGSHLQDLKRRTGSRIRIDTEAHNITLTGSAAAVHAAASFYRARFAEHAAAGAHFVRPTEAFQLLAPELTVGARFVPMSPGGELALHLHQALLARQRLPWPSMAAGRCVVQGSLSALPALTPYSAFA